MSGMTWKSRLADIPFGKKLLVVLNAVLLLACAASSLGLQAVGSTFETVTAADRFRGGSDTRFAQLACFLPVGKGKSEEDIWSLREKLDAKFVEQSLTAPEGGSLYMDAYSARGKISVTTDHASAEVSGFGVGGDFFHFHPLRLRSGTYIAERDLMDDLVVLDEALAWRFFGGVELSGMTLYINGEPFVVAGVVAMEDDFAARRALTEEGTMFLSYSALARLDDSLSIDCYEIVMPDPISGYARGVMEELMGADGGTIVENSGRFSPGRLLDMILRFGERSMRTGAVVYPYWENALRIAEDHAALLAVLVVITAMCPVITLAVLIVRGIMCFWRFVRREVPERLGGMVERSREKRYARLKAQDREGE